MRELFFEFKNVQSNVSICNISLKVRKLFFEFCSDTMEYFFEFKKKLLAKYLLV